MQQWRANTFLKWALKGQYGLSLVLQYSLRPNGKYFWELLGPGTKNKLKQGIHYIMEEGLLVVCLSVFLLLKPPYTRSPHLIF